ncbi:MAG: AbrB/MazE/SpoVT family DNA-binding domain-containing protein [Gammaproteobacteria bacterium]|nr:AbrB/MazE/SpoVT family DNA-binding domain-containing protein [Gammaproteobacteria bacterium]
MGAKLRVGKWGSSLAVRIPKTVADQCGISEGSLLDMEVRSGQLVVRRRKYDLEELVSQITPENQHPEIFDGPPRGHEEW